MTNPHDYAQHHELATAARRETRRATLDVALKAGTDIITRPAFRGSTATARDVEPLAGMRAAHQIELAARRTTRDYIRDARQAGHSWSHIGAALDLHPGAEPDQAGETTAEATFTYAAGRPDTEAPWRPRSFAWTCRSCDQLILDHGPIQWPADDEPGHAQGCVRLAAAVTAWNAQSEAEP